MAREGSLHNNVGYRQVPEKIIAHAEISISWRVAVSLSMLTS